MKPARRLRPLGAVKPDRVLVLLVEADRASCAEDLVGVAHLAAGRDAAEVHVPHDAALEAAHELGVVVVGDRLRLVTAGPGRVHGLDLGH